MKVHHRHNKDAIRLDLVENPMRETMKDVAADVAANEAKRLR